MEDLKARTGLDIQKIEIGNVDFLRDVAYIKVFYIPGLNHAVNQINSSDLRPSDF